MTLLGFTHVATCTKALSHNNYNNKTYIITENPQDNLLVYGHVAWEDFTSSVA